MLPLIESYNSPITHRVCSWVHPATSPQIMKMNEFRNSFHHFKGRKTQGEF